MKNKFIERVIDLEAKRQNNGIELIASENYVSKDIREAAGSILTDKYAEGYPGKRYYGGCEFIDEIEQYAIDRACQLFKCCFANVQPHSGSQANAAAYRALMPNGGKVLTMCLNDGGHLSHGAPVSFSSHQYEFKFFPLGANGRLDYNIVEEFAEKEHPDVILTGYSAYPYVIDFVEFRRIANKVGAKLMVDMAHIAGLIAAGLYPSPVGIADIITSTTQKTLRGPRGGLILTDDPDLAAAVDKAVFPYYQGGPLEHIVAAKAICFDEALQSSFSDYIGDVLTNTRAAATAFHKLGAEVSGTETHLFLLNTLKSYGLTGRQAQQKLETLGITTNKNMLPQDTLKPNETSGLRIGFAAATTRGCSIGQARNIASLIDRILKSKLEDDKAKRLIKGITKSWKDITKI